MAGTRLAINATFVVELLLLVTASFFYASNQKHDPFSSAEPFFADQSGWQILVEDVSSPDDTGIVGSIGGFGTAVMSQISSLMGMEVDEPSYYERKMRNSAFVQEMRQKVAEFRVNEEGGQPKVLPPLTVNLSMPQVKSFTLVKSLATSLERGFQNQSTKGNNYPTVRVGIAENDSNIGSCDDFQLPVQSKMNRSSYREVKFPEIVLLMDCSSATIPNEQLTHVEVNESDDIIVVRTKLSVDGGNELHNQLERYISGELLSTLFIESPTTEYRLGSISIKLIDEDPMSHAAEGLGGPDGFTAKAHFDILGKSLSTSFQKAVSPLLNDLSFIYGGNIEVETNVPDVPGIKVMNAIRQEVHSSAYLPLPDDIIESDTMMDGSPSNYVSPDDMANWLTEHSHQPRRHAYRSSLPGNVEWNLFVPAKEHAPLFVRDDTSGEEGESINLSPPTLLAEKIDLHPNGMSIVKLPNPSDAKNVDLDKAYHSYTDKISTSLAYLVGYIRAIHGLPTKRNHPLAHRGEGQTLSFWEMESIARSHYSSTLESVFHETDTLLAVMHQHSWTLAFPQEVAHKLNNATYLLRQSISFVEQGYPTIYATSLLHGSLQYLESVQSDHQFHELPYFAPDHYLAVFSPLVLPLFLPMIAGLVREVKRFRELQKKKNVIP